MQTTHPEPTPLTPSSNGLSHSGPLLPCPITPGPGTRQPAPVPHSLLKFLKLAYPKPAHPASPVPSLRNHNKGSCLHFFGLVCFYLSPSSAVCFSVFSFYLTYCVWGLLFAGCSFVVPVVFGVCPQWLRLVQWVV